MEFERLQVKSLRNLTEVSLEPATGLNLLIGRNASGKTALLEAIYCLSRARSFRTARIREVVQHGKDFFQIGAQLRKQDNKSINTGMEKGGARTLIRYDGETVKTVSTQARKVPLILITPDSHQLVTGTPKQRRHWLDWAMFHVEPDYLDWWRSYHKSLRQRNSLLRAASINSREIEGWEKEMAAFATRIHGARIDFVKELGKCLHKVINGNIFTEVQLLLREGWAGEKLFLDCLVESREGDRRAGYTRIGPHKADLCFLQGERDLGAISSRGQIKLFVNALLIAQAKVYELYSGEKPVFLLDDFAAELDRDSQNSLLALLLEQSAQVFLTVTELGHENDINDRITLFHVEHGKVSTVVK